MTRRTSLTLPATIPLDEWRRIGRQIFAISESSTWWLGDWLIYGQANYPDRYKRAITETGLDYQTLRNYAWVARQFPPERRRDTVSFQHHAELASLPAGHQDEWLDQAEKSGWSRNELRNRLKASRKALRGSSAPKPDEVLRLQVNVIPDQQQRWQDAAATTDQDLLTWIASVLDDASDRAS
ncbi:hypothetical protein JOF56_010153 [Kibdelosporangium banguiense]|uniref:LmbU n=1 Tax=Kibdelosporangium banguiense TaxID=1365924 RepID=A0ABS4U0J7_9PSEU|nr:LmbU family transcriptional regulator [Kibdelosporangium banguiense]MBP2329768.1 hypothetical protein [Kibdelosporangium banguiense]